ncbi:hypothetical protein GWK78_04335 [Candidatus Saccharibacteria bacterium oral taxon 488]|nr:hypothetical protein GWK78_04335 [Candidatus Saccharibacteria bacterium oral taxon 488]
MTIVSIEGWLSGCWQIRDVQGLMAIDQAYGDAWVRLTTRGKRLVQRIWPEAQAMAV